MRRVPSNVEKADLIQAGLIAVAQAALTFEWTGAPEDEQAKESFVRYAQQRVKGAMLDELRQMDQLPRAERRKIKIMQIAQERWRAQHGQQPTLAQLSAACGMGLDELARLEHTAALVQTQSLDDAHDADEGMQARMPATAKDEVEARVDTAILLRRLAEYFKTLPEHERLVIDSYLGIGLTPTELAGKFGISTSRISQIYRDVCRTISRRLGHGAGRATDPADRRGPQQLNQMITAREMDIASATGASGWGELMEKTLLQLRQRPLSPPSQGGAVRWG